MYAATTLGIIRRPAPAASGGDWRIRDTGEMGSCMNGCRSSCETLSKCGRTFHARRTSFQKVGQAHFPGSRLPPGPSLPNAGPAESRYWVTCGSNAEAELRADLLPEMFIPPSANRALIDDELPP